MTTTFSGKEFDSETLTKEQALFLVSNFENDALSDAKINRLKNIVYVAGGTVERYNGVSKLIGFNKNSQIVGEY